MQINDSTESKSEERFDPATMHGQMIESEHLARYRWATQFASGRRVLDVACGTGYGCELLAAAGAKRVVGADVDAPTIERARADHSDQIEFLVADINSLPFEDNAFDLIACFETIEHVAEPGPALDELHRVLAPAGILAISSPNRGVYPEGNSYHLHELTADEMSSELQSRFSSVLLRRQHTWICSGVFDDENFATSGDQRIADADVRKLNGNEPGAEIYTLGLASDQPLPPDRPIVMLNEPIELRTWDGLWQEQRQALEDLTRHSEQQVAFIEQQRQRLEQIEREYGMLRLELLNAESQLAQNVQLQAELDELHSVLEEMRGVEDQLRGIEDQREHFRTERDKWLSSYELVVGSSSWKLTAPLRHMIGVIRSRGW